jgi:hypothetical protein
MCINTHCSVKGYGLLTKLKNKWLVYRAKIFQMQPQGKWVVYRVREHGFNGMNCDCVTVLM